MPGINLGDIRLNGVEYAIDLTSYRVRDIVDFAPRAATPGGSIVHSELGLYQPYLKTDWRHGLGFMWETDALGYLQTDIFQGSSSGAKFFCDMVKNNHLTFWKLFNLFNSSNIH